LVEGQWLDVKIAWDESKATFEINGQQKTVADAFRPFAHGLNYLRIEARSTANDGEIQVADLATASQ
jgi:hypothetical protein